MRLRLFLLPRVVALVFPVVVLTFIVLAAALTARAEDVTVPAVDVTVLVQPGKPGIVPGGPEVNTVFPTIQNAIDHAPVPAGGGRIIIRITPGVYRERIWIPRNRPRITLLGLGSDPSQTVISSARFAQQQGGTFFTETAEILGDDFQADNLTFQNDAGPVGQALAISVLSDRAVFKRVRFLGWQDTLFANWGRQYYLDCYIAGAVDFIFGNATAVFEDSEIHALGSGYLTAQSRLGPTETTGYVFIHDKLTSEKSIDPAKGVFLGRPWRPYSRVVYLDTEMDAGIRPEGWNNWGGAQNEATAFYGEYNSTGPGANPAQRVPWSHLLTELEAMPYRAANFLRGSDNWDAVAAAKALP